MVLSCTRGKITLIQYTVRYCPRQQNLYYCSYFKKTKKIHLKNPTKLIKTIFYRWIQTTRIHCTCACALPIKLTLWIRLQERFVNESILSNCFDHAILSLNMFLTKEKMFTSRCFSYSNRRASTDINTPLLPSSWLHWTSPGRCPSTSGQHPAKRWTLLCREVSKSGRH